MSQLNPKTTIAQYRFGVKLFLGAILIASAITVLSGLLTGWTPPGSSQETDVIQRAVEERLTPSVVQFPQSLDAIRRMAYHLDTLWNDVVTRRTFWWHQWIGTAIWAAVGVGAWLLLCHRAAGWGWMMAASLAGIAQTAFLYSPLLRIERAVQYGTNGAWGAGWAMGACLFIAAQYLVIMGYICLPKVRRQLLQKQSFSACSSVG